jgi:serine/threonine-protein kinase
MLNKAIGNWIIEALLSKGGMAEVYLARHKHLKTLAAIKVLAPTLLPEASFRERFFQEAQTQAQLRHPHIAQVLDFCEEDGTFFEVIEYLPGGTLAEILQKGTPPLPLVITWTKQVLSGLSYAHEHGVIHRDIKPSNIMLDQQRNAKLTDFGIAVLLGERRLTITGRSIGTPEYMSPEQIQTPRAVDKQSDIYSMGVVVFELLTGRVPFLAESEFEVYQRQVNDPPPSIRAFNESVPQQLDDVILKALNKAPAHRYQTCRDFLLALDSFEKTASFHGIPQTRLAPGLPVNHGQMPGASAEGSLLGGVPGLTGAPGRSGTRRSFAGFYYAATLGVILLFAVCAAIYWHPEGAQDSGPPQLPQAIQPNAIRTFEEKLLATIPEDDLELADIPLFSPAGNKVAYPVQASSNTVCMVTNGVRGPAFNEISLPRFSADGSKMAYYATQGKKGFVVMNEWRSAAFDTPILDSFPEWFFGPRFSEDGSRLLYVAGKGSKLYPVSGDWRGPEFDAVRNCQFSPDGSTIAYVARQGSRQFVVLGDWNGPEYDAISWLTLSRNGRKAAYVATQNGKAFVVSGDWKSPVYDAVSFLAISDEGDKLLYVAKRTGKEALILKGKQVIEHDEITFAELSPGGDAYAYAVRQGGKCFAVVDGSPQGEFDQVWNMKFSPDETRVAYCAELRGRKFVVCGQRRTPECDYVSNIQFSPDSRQIGYGARIGRGLWWKVLDLD